MTDHNDQPFDLVTPEQILNGRATDAYFLRTEEILEAENENPHVVAEVEEDVDEWYVLAGLKDLAALLEGKDIDVYARPEGSLFRDGPVLRIEGPYLEFCRFETSILGFITRASGVATKAMRSKAAAGERIVLSFGTRRQHPATAAMVERSALVGGMDGVSHVAGAETIGAEAGGTMPHALVICMRDQVRAWTAYDRVLDEDIPRVMLCDTYDDEKSESLAAAEALGEALDAVRLDTTSSRRGNLRTIAEEVRWELDTRGFEDVDIFLSGGIDAEAITELRDVADGFGIGGYVANSDPVDFSLDIVEVEGEPAAKRGEKGYAKQVFRKNRQDVVVPEGEEAGGTPQLKKIIEKGEVVEEDLSYGTAREHLLNTISDWPADQLLPFRSE